MKYVNYLNFSFLFTEKKPKWDIKFNISQFILFDNLNESKR